MCLCQKLSYYCVVCYCLRPKMVWTVWFQLVILSTVVLFIIVMWNRSSYIDLFMFDSLVCLLFLEYHSHGFRLFSIYFLWLLSFFKLPKYRRRIHFWQYCTDFVFKKKNMKTKMIWPPINHFRSFSSLDQLTTKFRLKHIYNHTHAWGRGEVTMTQKQIWLNCMPLYFLYMMRGIQIK